MIARSTAKNINEYIGEFPPDVQLILEKIRQTIRQAAPEAQETINYAIPTFNLYFMKALVILFQIWIKIALLSSGKAYLALPHLGA